MSVSCTSILASVVLSGDGAVSCAERASSVAVSRRVGGKRLNFIPPEEVFLAVGWLLRGLRPSASGSPTSELANCKHFGLLVFSKFPHTRQHSVKSIPPSWRLRSGSGPGLAPESVPHQGSVRSTIAVYLA